MELRLSNKPTQWQFDHQKGYFCHFTARRVGGNSILYKQQFHHLNMGAFLSSLKPMKLFERIERILSQPSDLKCDISPLLEVWFMMLIRWIVVLICSSFNTFLWLLISIYSSLESLPSNASTWIQLFKSKRQFEHEKIIDFLCMEIVAF